MNEPKLYMLLLGCKPQGRLTEQHDVFFGISNSLKELVPHLHRFWPEAKRNLHIDAWREVSSVAGHVVKVVLRENAPVISSTPTKKLFFLNLGGYKKNEFEEYHYNFLAVADDLSMAIQQAKEDLFYKHTGFKGATSHIDGKYGIALDDSLDVEDSLDPIFRKQYTLQITAGKKEPDAIQLGFLQLWKIKE